MKKEKILLVAAVVLFFGGSFLVKTFFTKWTAAEMPSHSAVQASGTGEVQRIISLAPSVTETLFLLGLEEKLVGVTSFCKYPPEADTIKKVGGYSTPDFEIVVMLKPDLVIMMHEHKKVHLDEKFLELGIEILFVSTGSISDILESITIIGKRCGASEKAEAVMRDMQKRIETIRNKDIPRVPVILVTVGKNMGSAGLKSIFVAGRNTYYNDMIEIAGGKNGYSGSVQDYVNLSGEALLLISPDIIIDIVPELEKQRVENVLMIWNDIPGLKAAAGDHVIILRGEYAARPGPSFIKVLEEFSKVIEEWNRYIQ